VRIVVGAPPGGALDIIARLTGQWLANRLTKIGPHAAAAIRLLILTGARLREILGLKWEYVDFERGCGRCRHARGFGKKILEILGRYWSDQ
jgi:integrase